MTWFAVYRTDGGELVSVGSVLAAPLPDGLAVAEYAERPDGAVVRWDPAVLDFAPIPPAAPVLTRIQYAQKFTLQERGAIRSSADPVVEDLVYQTELTDTIDLGSPNVVAGVQYLEAQGLIAPGRAAEILAG